MLPTILGASLLAFVGCGVFNPAFVDLVAPDTFGGFSTIDNAPGHVVITFVNNAEVEERLITYLESAEGGRLNLTALEKRQLRPRVRFRVQVTFTNGEQNTFEFVDGTPNLIDQDFAAEATADLNQNDLNNSVVLCDVARVEVAQDAPIEVFVPVELLSYQLIQVPSATGGIIQTDFELRERVVPQFTRIQEDETDADGNVTLRRNIGVRDVAAPVLDPRCGSVVAITMNGVLSVPFLDGVDDDPSFDQDDARTVAGIGGRYEFIVSVQ